MPVLTRGRRGRDRVVIILQLPVQSMSITTDVVSSNPPHDTTVCDQVCQ
jgi:hypothetical protein